MYYSIICLKRRDADYNIDYTRISTDVCILVLHGMLLYI